MQTTYPPSSFDSGAYNTHLNKIRANPCIYKRSKRGYQHNMYAQDPTASPRVNRSLNMAASSVFISRGRVSSYNKQKKDMKTRS